MKDRCFLDTNVFIYAIDTSSDLKEKRQVARHLIKEHIEKETGVISIQVLQEFYRVSNFHPVYPQPLNPDSATVKTILAPGPS